MGLIKGAAAILPCRSPLYRKRSLDRTYNGVVLGR
jgi:hypothetical protein